MPIEKLIPKFIFDEERLKQLKQIAPEAFVDKKINWEVLRESLGDHLEEDGQEAEHYGLFWPGKREARRLTALPSKGAIVQKPGEGVDEEKTHNIFIEGENLEVLKLLQKSYGNPGQIKLIYIDPPYNTGNDFVYEDDFKEPLEEYLKRTGQLDEEGKPMTTNTRSDGRFHSKWLSMMYPRLRLARNLLRDDGVIFISIDDNEVHNLRQIMNEVFGEENFAAQIIVNANPKGRVMDRHFSKNHEYILVYVKDFLVADLSIQKTEEEISEQYSLKDENGFYRKLELRNTHRQFGKHNRKNLYYPIYYNQKTDKIVFEPTKGFEEIYPIWDDGFKGCWTWGLDKAKNEVNFLLVENVNGKYKVFRKGYAKNLDGDVVKKKLKSMWLDNKFNTERGNDFFDEVFGYRPFSAPKPVDLIKECISMCEQDDIILDFFSGSGTTAQAVYELSLEDNLNRNFLLVQMPEVIDDKTDAYKNGYRSLEQITIDRIKKASKKFKKENSKTSVDLGFKVFKLTNSNFKSWKNYDGQNIEELEKQFALFSTPLIDKWNQEDLLFEVLLLEGYPLDSKTELQKDFKKNKVIQVASDFCEHKLLVCLDKKIAPETVANLKLDNGDIFVCLDIAITDQDKVRLADKGLIKTI